VRDGQTTPDGAITWHSTIECLGACGGAPMMQVDHRFEEDLTREKVDTIFERLRTEPAPHEMGHSEKAVAVEPVKGEKARSGAEGARPRGKKTQK
jgi:hypothetical protein